MDCTKLTELSFTLLLQEGASQYAWNYFHTALDVEGNSTWCHQRIQNSVTCMWNPTLLWKHVKNNAFRSRKLRRSNGCKVQARKVGTTSEILVVFGCGWQDGWWDSIHTKVCLDTYFNYTYVDFWISKFWFRMCILELVKVHWLDDECLLYWVRMPFFQACLVQRVIQHAKDSSYLQWIVKCISSLVFKWPSTSINSTL